MAFWAHVSRAASNWVFSWARLVILKWPHRATDGPPMPLRALQNACNAFLLSLSVPVIIKTGIRGIIEYEAIAQKSFLVSWNLPGRWLKICAISGLLWHSSHQFSLDSHSELQVNRVRCYSTWAVMVRVLPACLTLSMSSKLQNYSCQKVCYDHRKARSTVTNCLIFTQPGTNEEASREPSVFLVTWVCEASCTAPHYIIIGPNSRILPFG